MKWVLFVMLFTTAAYNKTDKVDPIAKENEHLWALQSSTSMEFSTHAGCRMAGQRLYTAVQPVATMTFRGYCLCESTDPKNKCPEPSAAKTLATEEVLKREPDVTTGIETIGPPRAK